MGGSVWGPGSYVKVDVAVLGSSSPYGLCGCKATLNSNETSLRAAQGLCGSRDDDDELMLNVLRCHLTY